MREHRTTTHRAPLLPELLEGCGRAGPTGGRRRTSPSPGPPAPRGEGTPAQRQQGPRREPPPRPGRRFWKVPPGAGPASRERRARGEPAAALGKRRPPCGPGRGQDPASTGLRRRWPLARPSPRGRPRYLCCRPRSPRRSPSGKGAGDALVQAAEGPQVRRGPLD